jgi:hypothetical protein
MHHSLFLYNYNNLAQQFRHTSAELKTGKSLCWETSFNSPNFISKRMSGLSLPYVSLHNHMYLGNSATSILISLANDALILQNIQNVSLFYECYFLAIYLSKLGCLSARASSRKHFTIWKYLTIPPTNNCLKVCGDCGKHKIVPHSFCLNHKILRLLE